jgi:putative transposase
MNVRHSGHGVYNTEYHVCFVTKYRRDILNPGLQAYIRKLLPKITRQMPGVEIIKVGIEKDHVHLIMIIPPKYSVSAVIAKVKSQTAGKLRQKFSWLGKVFWRENVVWTRGYFVSTVGTDRQMIRKYVEWQGRQDSGQIQLNLFR